MSFFEDDLPEELVKRVGVQPETTTLWDFPTQSDKQVKGGDNKYRGVTPARVIWNFLHLWTQPGDLVLDPFCGSGTTIDVAEMMDREAVGSDVHVHRDDIELCDARNLSEVFNEDSIDAVFCDSPYGDNIDYGDNPEDIGKIPVSDDAFFEAMAEVIDEIHRVLKSGGPVGWLIGDESKKGRFIPAGWRIYQLFLERDFEPVEYISVTVRNQAGTGGLWHYRATKNKFLLRGFHHFMVFRKI